MLNADFFGYAATSLNVVMLIPQVIRTLRTKQTRDLSFATLMIFTSACILWIVYGLIKQALPVIISNTVVGMFNIILLIIKLTSPNTK